MAVIAAILRAQILSMRLRTSSVWRIVPQIVWYGIWAVVAGSAGMLAASTDPHALAEFVLLGFLTVFLYWQLVPIFSANLGAALDVRKLLVYPVPHGRLFAIDLMLRLTSAVEMLMVLAAGAVGVLCNRAAKASAPVVVSAVLLFLIFNLLLSSAARSILERWMAKRRIREWLGLVLLLLYAAPRLLMYWGVKPTQFRPLLAGLRTVVLPWAAAAQAALPAGTGERRWLAIAVQCAWAGVTFVFARAQFEHNLRFDTVAAFATENVSRATAWQRWADRFYRIPSLLLPDPLAAAVEKEIRSLARTPRFRTVFLMGFTFGLAIWLPAMASSHSGRPPEYFLVVVCVYALTLLGQVTYWNAFGFDGSAAAIYFLAPQRFLNALVGKNIAALFWVLLDTAFVAAIGFAFRLASGWSTLIETVAVVVICALYMLALGNMVSVNYPRPLNPRRAVRGGNSAFQGLLFVFYPVVLLPVGLAYLARWALRSNLAFALVLAIAAIIGGVVYWIATESAVHAAGRRRERFLQDLATGDGPVAGS